MQLKDLMNVICNEIINVIINCNESKAYEKNYMKSMKTRGDCPRSFAFIIEPKLQYIQTQTNISQSNISNL